MWDELTNPIKRSDEYFCVPHTCLAESYRRCESAGVGRDIALARDILQGTALSAFREKYQDFAHIANTLFSDTLRNLQDQKTCFILTDRDARVITISAAPSVLASAATCGIVAGASLGESSLGTNAISLALNQIKQIVIRGDQHFCQIFADWYCVAVPLKDSNDCLVACLDISFGHDGVLGEKVALAKVLATTLEIILGDPPPIGQDTAPNVPQLHSEVQRLTRRQQDVLILFSQGLSYKQIAKALQLQSHKTVEKHLDAVRVKFSAKTRRECIQKAVEFGVL